jgi:hypothetical protein
MPNDMFLKPLGPERLLSRELGWVLIEFLFAALRTEVISLALELTLSSGLLRIHIHSANGIFGH